MKLTAKDRARLRKHLAAMQREYARCEKALVKAALVGCMRRDPTYRDQNEASSSGRKVDVSREVENLRYARNELTMIEDYLKRMGRERV